MSAPGDYEIFDNTYFYRCQFCGGMMDKPCKSESEEKKCLSNLSGIIQDTDKDE